MNESQLRQRFPRGSKAFFDANLGLCAVKPEPSVGATLGGEARRKTQVHEIPRVSIILYRVRLLDPDNAYGSTKTLIDCLCAVGLIVDDSPSDIELAVSQVKVSHRSEQKTVVNIKYP